MAERLPHNLLKRLSDQTGMSVSYLSSLAGTHMRPGRQKALILQNGAAAIGKHVPAMLWLYGTADEIRAALSAEEVPENTNPEGEAA